jgi:hypothetical protein
LKIGSNEFWLLCMCLICIVLILSSYEYDVNCLYCFPKLWHSGHTYHHFEVGCNESQVVVEKLPKSVALDGS